MGDMNLFIIQRTVRGIIVYVTDLKDAGDILAALRPKACSAKSVN